MLLFSYLGRNQVHCIKILGIIAYQVTNGLLQRRILSKVTEVSDGEMEPQKWGVPGLPASLLSLEYEEKDHGSREGAKAEDDQEHFLQKKTNGRKGTFANVGVSYLCHA